MNSELSTPDDTDFKFKTVAVAGASGFVGQALCRRLFPHVETIALSRTRPSLDRELPWRACDLFSLLDAEKGLAGVDVAFYLIHSMLPSARLTEGGFDAMDFIAADNFGRAAAAAGVRQIIYLGGLVPKDCTELSTHLASRLETEKALGAYGVPVTALRAGMVVGAGGSSFWIMLRLVERLPWMLCPRWSETKTQPIALPDILSLLTYCAGRRSVMGRSYDVGGPDVLSYREMLAETARVLGLKRRFVKFPYFTPGLSRLWVTLITGAPAALVRPLVQSLRHPMVADDRTLQQRSGIPGTPFAQALRESIREMKTSAGKTPFAFGKRTHFSDNDVRSVQRLHLPRGMNVEAVGREYMRWLPRVFPWFLHVLVEGDVARFCLRPLRTPLLILCFAPARSSPDRSLFYIKGGLLAKIQGRGRFEFRRVLDTPFLIAAIHEYRPRLPWLLYRFTQARIHGVVMWAFDRHLRRIKTPTKQE